MPSRNQRVIALDHGDQRKAIATNVHLQVRSAKTLAAALSQPIKSKRLSNLRRIISRQSILIFILIILAPLAIQANGSSENNDVSGNEQPLELSIAETHPQKYVFDDQVLPGAKRINNALLPGIIIQLTQSAENETYRWSIVVLIAIVVIETILLVILYVQSHRRKTADKAAREFEGYLRLIVESTPMIVFATDDKGIFTLFEEKGFAALGLQPRELVGKSALRLFKPTILIENSGAKSTFVEIFRRVKMGETIKGITSKDGWDFDVQLIPLKGADGRVKGIVGIATDITERKQAEDALRRNEELFRAVVEDQTEMIMRWKPDGTRTFVNQAYCRFIGKSAEELIGTSFFPLVMDEEDRQRLDQKIRSLSPAHPVATDAHECLSPDGTVYIQQWTDRGIFDAQGRLVELQSTGRDITDQCRAEEALRESESRWRTIFDDALIGIALLDEEGRPVQSNPTLQRMLGYTGDELRQMPCAEFTHPEDVNKDDLLYSELISGLRNYYQIEKRYISKSGQVVWGNLTVSVLRNQRGEQKLLAGMLEDITERKQAEEQVGLMQTITRQVVEAKDLSSALEMVLRQVCEKTGWVFGQAWLPRRDGAALECGSAFFYENQELNEFRAVSRGISFAPDAGLPGRVWSSGQPIWIQDVTTDKSFSRASVAARAGLKAALGVPILSGPEVIAVIEFFLCEPMSKDERLVKVITAVAAQLGLVIERKRAEDENHKLLHDLGERVKELTALHGAARLLQQEWSDTATMLHQVAALLPPAFQYPEITAVRLHLGGVKVQTPNFTDALAVLRADFTTADGQAGSIEITYTKDCPREAEGPFLSEERSLINTLADMLRTTYDHRQAEAALRESEERFRQLTENIREVFWMNKPDYSELLYISPAYETVWGRTRESLYKDPRSFLDPIHPDDRERAITLIEQGGSRGFELEYRIVWPNGDIRWIWDRGFPIKNDAGEVYRIAGIAEDITERKQSEAALKESEERFRQIAENIQDVIWICDSRYQKVLYVNPAYEVIWGRQPEILTQRLDAFIEAVHPLDREKVIRIQIDRTHGIHQLEEYRIIQPDGTVRWIQDRSFPIRDQAGNVYRIAGIAQDITERKLAEEQLKTNSEQLRALMARLRSAKEEEGIRIAREIHDELGSALTSLRWDLEGIDRTFTETASPQLSPHLHEKIEAMLDLIDGTVNVVRRISSELRPSVLDDLGLAEAIEWQAQQFQARTGIVCHYDCLVESDEIGQERSTAIFRIFQEALTNVLRHAQATEVHIKLEKLAGEIVLTISDNGRGISDREQRALHSLGLLGMRERAHLIGGKVEITSSEGFGTTITLHVPVSAEIGN